MFERGQKYWEPVGFVLIHVLVFFHSDNAVQISWWTIKRNVNLVSSYSVLAGLSLMKKGLHI